MMKSQGLEVDNDNEPAPENIPATGEIPLTMNLYPGQSWGWDENNQRGVVIQTKKDVSCENDWLTIGKPYIDIFQAIFHHMAF